jgi:hypothetical protein
MQELTLQQELQLQNIEIHIKHLPREDLEKFVTDMCATMFLKENMYSDMLLRSAGIIPPYD